VGKNSKIAHLFVGARLRVTLWITRNHEALDGLYEYLTDVQAYISPRSQLYFYWDFFISGLIPTGPLLPLVGGLINLDFQIDTGNYKNLVFLKGSFLFNIADIKLVGICRLFLCTLM